MVIGLLVAVQNLASKDLQFETVNRSTDLYIPRCQRNIMTPAEAYGILGLKPGASEEAVKSAYKRMALKVGDPAFAELFDRYITVQC